MPTVDTVLRDAWRLEPSVTIGVRRPDGTLSWGVYTAEPLLDPETGRTAGAVVTFVDITERKRAEEARRESEDRNLPDADSHTVH